jgi:hypothetical protein
MEAGMMPITRWLVLVSAFGGVWVGCPTTGFFLLNASQSLVGL